MEKKLVKVFLRQGLLVTLIFGLVAYLFLTVATEQSAFAAPTIKLKLQSHLTPHDMNRTVPYFKNMLEKLTKGEMTLELHPVGAIVPAKEMLKALDTGVLDVVHCAEGYWGGEVPGTESASGLPMAFKGMEESWYFMWNKGIVEILRTEYAKRGAYFIPWEPWPTALMTKRPVRNMADLKGMKIRSYGGIGHWLKESGASVVFVAGGELYTALATGVVEGAHWNGAGPEYVMKFHEILKNYLQPYIQYSWNNVYVSMKTWNKLTPDQKTAFETAAQAAAHFSTQHTRTLEVRALDRMVKDHKVKVNWLSEAEQEKAQKIAFKAWDEVGKRTPVDAEIVKRLKEFVTKRELCDTIEKHPW